LARLTNSAIHSELKQGSVLALARRKLKKFRCIDIDIPVDSVTKKRECIDRDYQTKGNQIIGNLCNYSDRN